MRSKYSILIRKVIYFAFLVINIQCFAATMGHTPLLDYIEKKNLTPEESLAFLQAYNQKSQNDEDIDLDELFQDLQTKDSLLARAKDLKLTKKELGGLVLLMVASRVSGQFISDKLGHNRSLAALSPDWFWQVASAVVMPVQMVNNVLPPALSTLVTAPVGHEIVFRGLLQDGLLTRLPKYLLKKLGYKKKTADKIVKHPISAISRVILVNWLFAISHVRKPYGLSSRYGKPNSDFDKSMMRIRGSAYSQFFMGLIPGAAKEITDSIFAGMALHVMYNASMMAINYSTFRKTP